MSPFAITIAVLSLTAGPARIAHAEPCNLNQIVILREAFEPGVVAVRAAALESQDEGVTTTLTFHVHKSKLQRVMRGDAKAARPFLSFNVSALVSSDGTVLADAPRLLPVTGCSGGDGRLLVCLDPPEVLRLRLSVSAPPGDHHAWLYARSGNQQRTWALNVRGSEAEPLVVDPIAPIEIRRPPAFLAFLFPFLPAQEEGATATIQLTHRSESSKPLMVTASTPNAGTDSNVGRDNLRFFVPGNLLEAVQGNLVEATILPGEPGPTKAVSMGVERLSPGEYHTAVRFTTVDGHSATLPVTIRVAHPLWLSGAAALVFALIGSVGGRSIGALRRRLELHSNFSSIADTCKEVRLVGGIVRDLGGSHRWNVIHLIYSRALRGHRLQFSARPIEGLAEDISKELARARAELVRLHQLDDWLLKVSDSIDGSHHFEPRDRLREDAWSAYGQLEQLCRETAEFPAGSLAPTRTYGLDSQSLANRRGRLLAAAAADETLTERLNANSSDALSQQDRGYEVIHQQLRIRRLPQRVDLPRGVRLRAALGCTDAKAETQRLRNEDEQRWLTENSIEALRREAERREWLEIEDLARRVQSSQQTFCERLSVVSVEVPEDLQELLERHPARIRWSIRKGWKTPSDSLLTPPAESGAPHWGFFFVSSGKYTVTARASFERRSRRIGAWTFKVRDGVTTQVERSLNGATRGVRLTAFAVAAIAALAAINRSTFGSLTDYGTLLTTIASATGLGTAVGTKRDGNAQ